MSSVIKLLILSAVVTLNKGDLFVDERDSAEEPFIKNIYNHILSRQGGYGLVKFEEDINQGTNQNDFGRISFEDEHQPFKFEEQEYKPFNHYQNMEENALPSANVQGAGNMNQGLHNLQNIKKKRRRRKPRLQQPLIPQNQQNYYDFQRPNSHGSNNFLAGFRPPRRSPPPSTWSTILAALTSVTVNDDLQCIPMLVCQAAAKGLFGNSTILQFSQLNSLLAAYGSVSSSPIFVFGRAAILGMTAKNNPESCVPQYPLCPKDPEQLVYYLNNHNGGFFKFFKPPGNNQNIMPASYGLLPQQAAAVPTNIRQYYGLYPPNNLLQPHSQYLQTNFGPNINPTIQPISNYLSRYQGAEYGLQQSTNTPKYPFYPKNKEDKQEKDTTKVKQDIKREGVPIILSRAHSHKHRSKHAGKKSHKKRKHGRNKHKRKRLHRHHTDEDRRYTKKDKKAKRERELPFKTVNYLTIEDNFITQAPVPNTAVSNLESPMNVADLNNITPTRSRRKADPAPDRESTADGSNVRIAPPPSKNPDVSVTFDQIVKAIEVVSKQDDHHCLLLMLCENASRGLLNPYGYHNAVTNNYTIGVLRNMSDFGAALLYGLHNMNNTKACFKRYAECDTSGPNLIKYYIKKGFNKLFQDSNVDHFYFNFLRNQAGPDNGNWYGRNIKQKSDSYGTNKALSPPLNSAYYEPRQTFNTRLANEGYYTPAQYTQNYGTYQYPYNYLSTAQQVPLSSSYINPQHSGYPNSFGQVNSANSFPRFRRSFNTDYHDTNKYQLSEVVDKQIQKRIQNKPEIFAEDLDYNIDQKWKFPDVESNSYGGIVNKVRDNRHLKFPSEDHDGGKDLNSGARGFAFPEEQSNRPYYSDYNNNFDYNDDNSVQVDTLNSITPHMKDEDGVDIVYIVRGNGDPYHPEVVRLSPGEKIMY